MRRAAPGDAGALVELGRAVSSEPEAWLITEADWREVGDERRYLRAVRRSQVVCWVAVGGVSSEPPTLVV